MTQRRKPKMVFPAKPPSATLQLTYVKTKLAETQMELDQRDQQIVGLKAQLEVAERIASQQHAEMTSQDSIHAEELESMNKKLDRILLALNVLERK